MLPCNDMACPQRVSSKRLLNSALFGRHLPGPRPRAHSLRLNHRSLPTHIHNFNHYREIMTTTNTRHYSQVKTWKNVRPEQWDDWRWQMQNRIKDAASLRRILSLPEDAEEEVKMCLCKFRMAVTPYYAMLIDPTNPHDPVKMQAVPSAQELQVGKHDLEDPLSEDEFSPCPGIVHRYPDRVLMLVTHHCAMYCRHCTRRRLVGCNDGLLSKARTDECLAYIRSHPEIHDVLISGGDPLTLSDDRLEDIIRRLRDIPHVDVIRIGTRTPVVMPMRITDELLTMLKKYHPIWINTHFNHPQEITPESSAACERIANAGIPLGNQSVLLRGINNDAEILKSLFTKLIRIRVRPYYLYQCDLSTGIGHFRTSVNEGIDIIAKIRGFISGFAVPTFVIDAPGGGGKIPIGPEYIQELNSKEIVMKNFLGNTYRYPNEIDG